MRVYECFSVYRLSGYRLSGSFEIGVFSGSFDVGVYGKNACS